MFDINSLDIEIKQLKADTLSEYGKKVEIAIEMLKKNKRILIRERKISDKLNKKISKSPFFKRNRLKELKQRVDKKIKKLELDIERLKELKSKYINDYKTHREYLGLYDHDFIDKFYHK
jgi:predicted alpha/beta-fold hydrolase